LRLDGDFEAAEGISGPNDTIIDRFGIPLAKMMNGMNNDQYSLTKLAVCDYDCLPFLMESSWLAFHLLIIASKHTVTRTK
jgi:hypothetical protein